MCYKIKDPIWDGVTLKILRLYLKTLDQLLPLTDCLPKNLLRLFNLVYETCSQLLIQLHEWPRLVILAAQIVPHILVDVAGKSLPDIFKLFFRLFINPLRLCEILNVLLIHSIDVCIGENDLLVSEPLYFLEFHLLVEFWHILADPVKVKHCLFWSLHFLDEVDLDHLNKLIVLFYLLPRF